MKKEGKQTEQQIPCQFFLLHCIIGKQNHANRRGLPQSLHGEGEKRKPDIKNQADDFVFGILFDHIGSRQNGKSAD